MISFLFELFVGFGHIVVLCIRVVMHEQESVLLPVILLIYIC